MSGNKAASDFNVRDYRRPGISDAKIYEIKETFDLFDEDGLGIITPKNLKDAMVSLGFEPKPPTVYQMISGLDSNGSGAIDFDEFLDMMTTNEDKDMRDDIDKVFRLFDDDKKGLLSIKNLRRVSRELGENISDEELIEMIERADSDKDGLVTMDDFYRILTKRKYP